MPIKTKTELKKSLRKVNNPDEEAELEVLIEKHGYQGAILRLLIQIRNELRKLNKVR